jgi:two-component system sensor histidine kinase UhpB
MATLASGSSGQVVGRVAGRPAMARARGAAYRRRMNVSSLGAEHGVRAPWAARALLAAPLGAKLVGANVLVAAAAVAVALWLPRAPVAVGPRAVALVLGALAAALLCSLALVALALRPLHALEHTAERVWRGDLAARVPPSPLADAAVARVGHAFNAMLDGIERDRARMAELTGEVIRAGDAERARLGTELHESTAQTIAAALYQLSAAQQALAPRGGAPADPAAAAAGLAAARRLVADALDEVQALARGMRATPPAAPPFPPDAP